MPNGIQRAATFWIEAGAMSGPPEHRHQIEFSNDLVQFFDQQSRDNEVVTIELPDGHNVVRPLTYRGTDYGQWTDIWRLGLPTVNMGGPQYAGRYIRFDRLGPQLYRITVEDTGSAAVTNWRQQSAFVGNTGGPNGRGYGYF
jgi:hypothetical protein